ncbi:uncharacterized protein CBL_10286 [Carabus blaptoides fortunei]
MIRLIIYVNGTSTNGKTILLHDCDTIDKLLEKASEKFDKLFSRIFCKQGGEIDDVDFIRDNDVLYFSTGEDFINPNARSNQSAAVRVKSDWVTLNVGGKCFTTSKSTLTAKEPNSMLARMFAEDDLGYFFTPSNVDTSGAYLIDRSPTYFEPILNYLRNGQLIYDNFVNPEGILEEARFFGIESIIPILENTIQKSKRCRDVVPLSKRDVINALITTPLTSELRFQGVNLSGADLSKLDLRFINFKYANLQGCNLIGANLSWCCLERADLSLGVLDGAQLLGVKSLCANLEGASLRNCNFEDPSGSKANMEGVNLKSANLEGSHMAGVNLRVATLKHANLQNCNLRGAVLAGTDLENCDLSGSDLHEANLRGANLKDATFELMLTPLHMSQTIR